MSHIPVVNREIDEEISRKFKYISDIDFRVTISVSEGKKSSPQHFWSSLFIFRLSLHPNFLQRFQSAPDGITYLSAHVGNPATFMFLYFYACRLGCRRDLITTFSRIRIKEFAYSLERYLF